MSSLCPTTHYLQKAPLIVADPSMAYAPDLVTATSPPLPRAIYDHVSARASPSRASHTSHHDRSHKATRSGHQGGAVDLE